MPPIPIVSQPTPSIAPHGSTRAVGWTPRCQPEEDRMDERKLPSNRPSGLPTNGPAANMQQAFTARLTMQEAIAAVGKMLNAYPNARDGIRDGYMGTIAALLCQYPRGVASDCANPINGVCRETKFLPTVAEVVAWCEKRQGTMARTVEYEHRSYRQFREREGIEAED